MSADEIAIIGAGCRFPGADNLDEFWTVLLNGENHVIDIPDTRWNNAAFYDEDKNAPGKIYVKKAGLLKNHDKWDNRLFGIGDAEASRIDPQQRYVLECVHMAMEDGGLTRQQMSGSKTGVIIGCMNDDYKAMANSDLADISSYNATGTSTSVLSARVSFVYNLHGICLTLDTACSSALVAIHLASQAIQTGDCSMMICGGVSSILSPDIFVPLCKARMMSAIGQCQSFCDTADGYARGEGCGIVILKSLKAAIEDGNKIWATIKTGSNQDGGVSKPMTAPSGQQQLELLKDMYESHNICPSDIQYIEAHGTGTPRGDPTELNALGTFFSSTRRVTSPPLLVGSVKSNIGHTESAAGVAGLLKVLLMMKYGKYVPTLHVKKDNSNVNKNIQFSDETFEISTTVQNWLCNKNGERHACLNSFGFGGSNTHAVIIQRKTVFREAKQTHLKTITEAVPICISGIDKESLKLNLLHFQDDVESKNESLYDASITSFRHRDIFQYKTMIWGKNIKEMQQECKTKMGKIEAIVPKKRHKTVFVYCGVGTTWTGMCREFMKESYVFRKTVDRIDTYLKPLTNWTIAEKFDKVTSYDDPFLNHIAIFCVQVALTEVWRSVGVVPDTIVGQSVGEVAAAYAANLLSLEEAVKVIHHRSEILSRQSQGSMAVVGNVDVKKIENACSKHGNQVCVAVYSSPMACTLSGNKEDINKVISDVQHDFNDVFIRYLKVQCAYHSPLIERCMNEIKTRLDASLKSEGVSRKVKCFNTIQMISTVTGNRVTRKEVITGSYWAKNIRQSVLFMQAIKQTLDKDSYHIFVEIGPRPILKTHLPNILESTDLGRTVPSMTVKNEIKCLRETKTELFELGMDVNPFTCIPKTYQITRAPRYAFKRTGDLFIPNSSTKHLGGFSKDATNSHMYVATSKRFDDAEFQLCVDTISTPFVYDHFLSEVIVVPGATYVEAGFHIGMELFKRPVEKLSVAYSFVKTFTPSNDRQHNLQVQLESKTAHKIEFSILNEESILAKGSVSARTTGMRDSFDIEFLKALCPNYVSKSEYYGTLGKLNFRYGESLSLMQESWLSDSGKKSLTKIQLPKTFREEELTKVHFHPTVIDSAFQMFGVLVRSQGNMFAIPKGVGMVKLNKRIESVMYGFSEEIKASDNYLHYNSVLLSPRGIVIAEIENFYVKILSNDMNMHDTNHAYSLNWLNVYEPPCSVEKESKSILLFSDEPHSTWIGELGKVVQVIHKKKNNISTLSSDFRENIVILYHVAAKEEADESQDSLGSAVGNFLSLKKLIKLQQQSDSDVSIIIVTENTQPCPGRQIINYKGSELWGMILSVVHEGALKDVKLVDIERKHVDNQTLLQVVFSPDVRNIEFALHGSKIYRPNIQQVDLYNQDHSRRTSPVTNSDTLVLCSDMMSGRYLLLSNESVSIPRTVEITLVSFTTHSKTLYAQTVGDTENNGSLLYNSTDDNQILILEGRGKVDLTQTDVIFLYPVKAKTTVKIPKEHIIDRKDCPTYLDGTLILINILVHISSAVNGKTNVIVMKQCEESDIGQELFSEMMSSKSCTTQFCTTKELFQGDEPCFNHDTLIITTALSVEIWNLIIKRFPNLKLIVSINVYFPDCLRIWIRHNFPGLQVNILSTLELLDITAIREAMPKIKTYLRLCQPLVGRKSKNRFLLDLPMPNLQVQNEIKEGSLKCFCSKSNLFRSYASYIIVGGLTGLGWELLQLMAEMGAGTLITLSRRKPSNFTIERLEEIKRRHNCQICPIQADVSNMKSVQRAFSKIHGSFPKQPIKGIFHGGGVTDDAILDNLDEEKIRSVMKPKVLGVWNLHIVSLNLPLDYFVIHSSIVSIIGNPGQSNYAAANSFLDSFASYRRSKGLPAQSINWGALAVGMAVVDTPTKARLSRNGFNLLGVERVRELFLEAMVTDIPNVVYADVKWEKLLSVPIISKQTFKYSNVHNVRNKAPYASKDRRFDSEEIHKLAAVEKAKKVKAILREIIDEIFLIEDGFLDDETSLADIGIDSMAVTSLSNAVNDTFGCQISIMTFMAEATTLSTIVEIILHYIDTSGNAKTGKDIDVNDALEFQDIFGSKDVTFMQKDMLLSYMLNRKDPYYLTVVDVEIIGIKLSVDKWKAILRHVMKLNPGLGQIYHFTNDGDWLVKMAPEDSIDISIAEATDMTYCGDQGKDIRFSVSADIHGVLPMSFRFSEIKDKTVLRIIVHKIAIDMKGLSMLCMDIGTTSFSVVSDTELPAERPKVDVPTVVRNAVLPRMAELDAFWDSYLNADLTPVTLGPALQKVDENFYTETLVQVPHEMALTIKKFITDLKVSLYEFIMSLYQLYLYIGSKSSMVTVGTAADMRLHVPELNNVLTRCTNYIPILAHIQDGKTLCEFVKENSVKLSACTKNGAYPSSLILKKLRTVEAKENVFRHFLSMNDMTSINQVVSENDNDRVKIRRIWHTRPTRETSVFVQYDLKNTWIRFQMGYNAKICGEYGRHMFQTILRLAREAMADGNKTIGKVREEIVGDYEKVAQAVTDVRMYADVTEKLQEVTVSPSNNISMIEKSVKTLEAYPGRNKGPIATGLVQKRSVVDYRTLHDNSSVCKGIVTKLQTTMDKEIVITGEFKKQTSHGWDHNVQVTLSVVDRHRVMLEWGKDKRIRKRTNRAIDLSQMQTVEYRKINGTPSLIISSGKTHVILKTSDKQQAKHWMDTILISLNRLHNTN